jgi:hypothetical protein
LYLKDNIAIARVPRVNGTDMIEPWIPEADATAATRVLEAGGEIIGTATCENTSHSPHPTLPPPASSTTLTLKGTQQEVQVPLKGHRNRERLNIRRI